jgi:hypothetical protein
MVPRVPRIQHHRRLHRTRPSLRMFESPLPLFLIQRLSPTDQSTGAAESFSIAHAFSSYAVIVGQSSVSASLIRSSAFIWLSATWWTNCRTVHPPSRYGVSSCPRSNPSTASRSLPGSSARAATAAILWCGVTASVFLNFPTGYLASIVCPPVCPVVCPAVCPEVCPPV